MSFDNLIVFLTLSAFSMNSYSLSWKTKTSFDYLYFWSSNAPISVPLITANDNPLAFGIINEPGTRILFGSGSNTNQAGGTDGGRLTLASWIGKDCHYGFEVNFWGLSQKNQEFRASSATGEIPIVNIPFFSTTSASEDVLVDRLPNTATVKQSFQPFDFELNGLIHLQAMQRPFIGLVGLRYLNVHEKLTVHDALFNNPSTPNQVLNVEDVFSTTNGFYGLQLGAIADWDYCRFNLELSPKIALGSTLEQLDISGETNVNDENIIQPIGLFAEPSNIGCFKKNQFAVLPEIQAKLRYCLFSYLSATLTYNGLFISNILRPSREIDRNINTSQNPLLGGTGILSGTVSPLPQMNQTSLWLQGISLGLEFRY